MIRRTLLMSLALLCLGVYPVSLFAKEAKKVKILFVTESRGYQHGSVKRAKEKLSPAEISMIQLGQQSGVFEVHCTQNSEADFTPDNLKKYDIVMLYTTGVLPISDSTRDYFLNTWLKKKGHGIIGFHSATDTYRTKDPKHQWYRELIGGTFKAHPWTANGTVAFTVHDPQFPAMKPFGKEFEWKDEIYEYDNWVPENVHVLMSINMAKSKVKRPYHVPVAWAREWGKGRIYYNNLGHRPETWTNKVFLDSVVAAVKWVSGQIDADVSPNPEVSKAQHEKSKKDAAK